MGRDGGASEEWTTRRLREWVASALSERGVPEAKRVTDDLIAHTLGCERLRLFMEPDRPASASERSRLRGLVARAMAHEPVQYLVGEQTFFGLTMHVDRRVLIPRPSTETIVEQVLQHARGAGATRGALRVADVCTGSGCIAVALLTRLTGARGVATDIDEGALQVARQNAERHGVMTRLELRRGGLLDPIPVPAHADDGFDYLTANPPYIPDDEWEGVERNVRDHEPTLALRGGPEGLDVVMPLIEGAPSRLRAGGMVLIEVADAHAERALAALRSHALIADAAMLRDHEGFRRVVLGTRRSA